MPGHADPVDELADDIRQYLNAHPEAADTVDGVVQCWLPPSSASAPRETVRRALDRLVAGAEAVRRVLVDGSVIYARR